jgi:sortase A
VLITLGALLALLLVWELWWTNVQAVHAQAKEISSIGWAYDPQAPAPAPAKPTYLTPSKKPPEVEKQPPFLTTFATIYIPRFDKDFARTITEGVDKDKVLDVKGIGHYPGTAMPGAIGNFSIAGHRTTFGKPFYKINTLENGDPIIVQTKDGWYVYAMTSHLITDWRDGSQVSPVPGDVTGQEKPTMRMLTMTSCHPVWDPIHRYIVRAQLVYWAPPHGKEIPRELATGTVTASRLAGIEDAKS